MLHKVHARLQLVNVPGFQCKVQGEHETYILYLSKGLQCALKAITIVALWRFLHLGRRMCAYTLFGLHCEVTRVLKLRTVSDA